MKEYVTLVTVNVGDPYVHPQYSRPDQDFDRWPPVGVNESRLQYLQRVGWEVIDASCLPRLSTHDDAPRFAFILEREIPG